MTEFNEKTVAHKNLKKLSTMPLAAKKLPESSSNRRSDKERDLSNQIADCGLPFSPCLTTLEEKQSLRSAIKSFG
jgi:hypothetical protein